MKRIKNLLYISPIALLAIGCASGNNPGLEYAPDMYDAKSYEPFSQLDSHTLNEYGSNLRRPVKGSIAFGKEDYTYHLPNTGEGYERSATEVTMPANLTDANCEGKILYNIYCSPCHGVEGKNDGKVFQRATTLKPGAWGDGYKNEYIKTLPVGKIYHTLVYGKNNMGSHASVLTPTERWLVIAYVKQLSNGNPECAPSTNKSINTSKDNSDTAIEAIYETVVIDAEAERKIKADLAKVQFEQGSVTLTTESLEALKDLSELLEQNASLRVVISGYNDSKESNSKLSEDRAAAVKDFLVSQGYNEAKFITNGYGLKSSTSLTSAQNRTVTFTFIK